MALRPSASACAGSDAAMPRSPMKTATRTAMSTAETIRIGHAPGAADCTSVIRLTLILILLPVAAAAQTTGGAVVGSVSDESGAPLAGIEMTVTRVAYRLSLTARLASDGPHRVTCM